MCDGAYDLLFLSEKTRKSNRLQDVFKKATLSPQIFNQTASSLSFSSDLLREVHARASVVVARREKRERQPKKKKERLLP